MLHGVTKTNSFVKVNRMQKILCLEVRLRFIEVKNKKTCTHALAVEQIKIIMAKECVNIL